ncbi:uncharacterized protein CLUP02_18189 [Colletotrichum lupini]|uniref:Uncharacterized protein n=1 Tax=Colletotrichum lupini TaxID=145971 RepID=A0A9Q8SGS6_9PEZI|nr:uncharacterized protein CLUP02_18189 [Colletotrichum lupini]UQC76675.1 hypothetical protein CLUP02_18189 [Colletotrichum lupini]
MSYGNRHLDLVGAIQIPTARVLEEDLTSRGFVFHAYRPSPRRDHLNNVHRLRNSEVLVTTHSPLSPQDLQNRGLGRVGFSSYPYCSFTKHHGTVTPERRTRLKINLNLNLQHARTLPTARSGPRKIGYLPYLPTDPPAYFHLRRVPPRIWPRPPRLSHRHLQVQLAADGINSSEPGVITEVRANHGHLIPVRKERKGKDVHWRWSGGGPCWSPWCQTLLLSLNLSSFPPSDIVFFSLRLLVGSKKTTARSRNPLARYDIPRPCTCRRTHNPHGVPGVCPPISPRHSSRA